MDYSISKTIKLTNKTKKIYLISPIIDDNRLNPESENFMNDPSTTEDFKNSLLICDDIEAYSNKKQ